MAAALAAIPAQEPTVGPVARYAFLSARRRSRLNLDGPPLVPKRHEKPVMYAGDALRPDGVRPSEAWQGAAADALERAYGGSFLKELNIGLSVEDGALFEEEACRGPSPRPGPEHASGYGELLPFGVLDMLWRVGAKPGDRFYDLGAGPGKVVALAWLCGLRATG